MDSAAARLQVYRRRIARMVRRAETHPERAEPLLREDLDAILAELRRLARPEPAVVLEVLLHLLERLANLAARAQDGAFAAGLVPLVLERVQAVLRRDRAAHQVDRTRAVERLFRLWIEDEEGCCQDIDRLLLELAAHPADERALRDLLAAHIRTLPLVFPPVRGASDDLRRALLLADRHRSERLLGEVLACSGSFEYAVLVAQDHFRRTGDACDLVQALQRAGRKEEAITHARRALASPRSFQRERVQELLERLITDAPAAPDRLTRRELERSFVASPSVRSWKALKGVVPEEQWARVAHRLLSHLQKHQKVPTLLFTLWLEEGNLLEADGLVVTQPVDPDVLVQAAAQIAEAHPAMAAGWYMLSAHRRVGQRRPALYPKIVHDLLRVRDLAGASGQDDSFRRALEKFRVRHAAKPRLLLLLDRAGLR